MHRLLINPRLWIAASSLICAGTVQGGEIDWSLEAQTRHFFRAGTAGQDRQAYSAALNLEARWEPGPSQRIALVPFLRVDSEDSERTHGDLREFYWRKNFTDTTLYVGLRRVFWGATEALHLVDIINQTDLVENPDGEDKLGQPMVQLTFNRSWGNIDLFVLPGFRKRTFPGNDGRLGFAVPIDASEASFQSSRGRSRVDWAMRWFVLAGPAEFGISHFSGTAREPVFVPRFGPRGPSLAPRYLRLEQTALDLTAVSNAWLWKLELLSRHLAGRRSTAATGGFEWTAFGIARGRFDFGLILEYQFDDRPDLLNAIAQNDLVTGLRIGANDMASSELLLLAGKDLDGGGSLASVEASRRLGDRFRAAIEGRWFFGGGEPALEALDKDDYVEFSLTAFF